MAKVSFTKLDLKMNKNHEIVTFNGQDIDVKQYLPVNDKLTLISNVINSSADENNFANPVKIGIFTALEILYAYTNINFTDKQKEDPAKLYDTVISSGFMDEIIAAIPKAEYNELICGIADSVEAVYNYRNSILGILDSMGQDYDNLNFDISDLQNKLADPTNLNLLRDVLSKLG